MIHEPPLQRLLDALPRPVERAYSWLLRPHARWVRIPLGCVLIFSGFLGFLPVLGFWMLPIGALLIGHDIPPVHRVTIRALAAMQRWWDARRGSRSKSS